MDKKENLSTLSYVICGLSFIPLIGVFVGIGSIIFGLTTKKNGGKKIVIIGVCGISLSIVLYSTLFYFGFMKRGGVYDDLRNRLAVSNLTSLVKAIEFYKMEHGQYPKTLEILSASAGKESAIFINDPSLVEFKDKNMKPFYYELIDNGSHYHLLGVGVDRKPFTKDDLHPGVIENDSMGYRKIKTAN